MTILDDPGERRLALNALATTINMLLHVETLLSAAMASNPTRQQQQHLVNADAELGAAARHVQTVADEITRL